MAQPEFIFVADGGATKTLVELRRWDGTVLATGRAGPCNLYQDAPAAIASIRSAIEQCDPSGRAEPSRSWISAGVAGASAASGREQFREAFSGFGRCLLSGDGYTALVGEFGAQPGALVSIGTGVVGCRFDEGGHFAQLGGWGFLAGDRGGGAWLGLQLVIAWLEYRDGMGVDTEASPLWDMLTERLGDNRQDILTWLRSARPDGFAALVPDLLRAADQGGSVARRLREEAVAHIARLVRASSGKSDLPVALSGGLAAPLEAFLRARLGDILRPLTPISPLDGAWRIARGERPPEFV